MCGNVGIERIHKGKMDTSPYFDVGYRCNQKTTLKGIFLGTVLFFKKNGYRKELRTTTDHMRDLFERIYAPQKRSMNPSPNFNRNKTWRVSLKLQNYKNNIQETALL